MEDWESEDFKPVVSTVVKENAKNLWDEEDADEEDVKESWEDDDDSTAKETKPVPPTQTTISKPSAKAGGKKEKVSEAANAVLADPAAEKLRQQRLVEEADYKSTTELFAKRGDEKSLDSFIPKSESDFLEYAELISHKLRPYEKSFHYIGLLKAVMKLSMSTMKASDAKELASSISAIANEKLKAEKEANASKKKQTAKKKQLHFDKPDDDVVASPYDALDDYDFM